MEEWQTELLDKSLEELVDVLDIQKVLNKLRSLQIFEKNGELQNLLIHKTNGEKVRKIIDMVKNKGEEAYWSLCHCLDQNTRLFKTMHSAEHSGTCTDCNRSENSRYNNAEGERKISYECPQCEDLWCQKFGVSKIENIQELLLQLERNLEFTKQDLSIITSEKLSLDNKHRQLMEKNAMQSDQLELKERQLQEKENDCRRLLQSVEKEKSENVELQVKFSELQVKLVETKKDYDDLRNDYEKFHVKDEKKESLYVNNQTIVHKKIKDLEQKNNTLEITNDKLMKEQYEFRMRYEKLRVQKETVEASLQRQTEEKERIFTDFTTSNERLKLDLTEASNTITELENIVDRSKQRCKTQDEKEVIVCELIDKKLEVKNLQEKLANLKTEQDSLNSQYAMLEERYHNQTKILQREQVKVSEVSEAKDYLFFELNKEREHIQQLNIELVGKTSEVVMLNKEIDMLYRRIEGMIKMKPGEFEVNLTRATNRQFGVEFHVQAKKKVDVNESKVTIKNVDHSNTGAAPLANINEGDYVIRINDVNVQDADMAKLKSLFSDGKDVVKLILRKPKIFHTTKINLTQNLKDAGASLHLIAKVPTQKRDEGIEDGDEIIKIGRHDVNCASIQQLEKKIEEKIQRKQTIEVTVQRSDNISNRNARSSSTFGPDSHIKTQTSNQLIRNVSNEQQFTNPQYYEVPSYQQDEVPGNQTPPKSFFHSLSSSEHSRKTSNASTNSSVFTTSKPPLSQQVSIHSTRAMPTENSDCDTVPTRLSSTGISELENNPSKSLSSLYNTEAKQSQLHLRELQNSEREINPESSLIRPRQQYEIKVLEISKNPGEDIGIHILGGNVVGIFVDSIDDTSYAAEYGVRGGWKILKMNGVSFDKVAFCYAFEFMKQAQRETTVYITFEMYPYSKYQDIMISTRPYDTFDMEALYDHDPKDGGLAFRKGDKITVTNTHFFKENAAQYKWFGENNNNAGWIPRQLSCRAPSEIEEHPYETMGEVSLHQTKISYHYKILESVGQAIV